MTNKTCGECKYFMDGRCFYGNHPFEVEKDSPYCDDRFFKPAPKTTNGDKIIAGGMRAVAEFALHHCCNNCIYFDGNNPYRSTCGKPDDKTCEDGVEAWLNAPVESEEE